MRIFATILHRDHWFTGVMMWGKILEDMLRSFVRTGSLTLELPDGRELNFGDGTGDDVKASIKSKTALRRLVLNPELALGEIYTNGDLTVEENDLRGFLALLLSNIDRADRLCWQRWHARLRTVVRRFLQNNAPRLSRKNVAHHYDLSGELYDLFLDADRQYSCAYFRDASDTLEMAQAQKKDHIARKLRIEPGMKVLDIGCGWGGMALTLASDFGAHVTGITLSEQQLAIAKARAKRHGLQDKAKFELIDYRLVEGQFDRIVSVGMFEHVGLPNFDTYFQTVRDRLTPDGIALIHTIGTTDPPLARNAWLTKYIFPGGYVPSLSEMSASVERQRLWVTDIEFLWMHYAETLRHWYERFDANADKVTDLYDNRFVRMWRFYLAACEQTFRHRRQTVFQFQLTRSANVVPITRDYLYRDDLKFREAAE